MISMERHLLCVGCPPSFATPGSVGMATKDPNQKVDRRSEAAIVESSLRLESETRPRAWRESRALDDGSQFGRYAVVRLLGKGGMSEVYEALHTGLKKPVALKVLRADMAEHKEARERFVREGENAARIRHDNVVDVTDVGAVDGLPYLVMELLEGEDLAEVFAREGRLSVSQVVDMMLPIIAGIDAGHSRGVVHRDVKPENIFLHRDGRRTIPKVLDFGVSRVTHEAEGRRITIDANVLGTPQYMSPEQARGDKDADERTDQYAVGVMLYEGITGRLPRESKNPIELLHSVAFGTFRPPSDFVYLPAELEQVILRAMQREPDARFESIRDLGLALLPFASPAAAAYWGGELGKVPARTAPLRRGSERSASLQDAAAAAPGSALALAPAKKGKSGRVWAALALVLLLGMTVAYFWPSYTPAGAAPRDSRQSLGTSNSRAAVVGAPAGVPAASAAPAASASALQPLTPAIVGTVPKVARSVRPRPKQPVEPKQAAPPPEPATKPKIKVIDDRKPEVQVIQ